MIVYNNLFLHIARVWFDELPPRENVDIVYYAQSLSPIPRLRSKEFHTITIDLRQREEVIFSRFKKDTRNEIRRALTKDGIVCENPVESNPLLLNEFCEFYDRFAMQKHRLGADRKLLSLLSGFQSLFISKARASTGDPIVFHAYYYSKSRVRLLYSASLFRGSQLAEEKNLIGRMNRSLHWNDIKSFKNSGVQTYDLGGWYKGGDDEEKIRINSFKEEFGGSVEVNYDCEEGVSLKGRIALIVNRYLRGR